VLLLQLQIRGIKLGVVVGWVGDSGRRVEAGRKYWADMADADDYESLPQTSSTSTHMLAGAAAGIMEHCVMYPVDCVKVGIYPGLYLPLRKLEVASTERKKKLFDKLENRPAE